MTEEPRIRGLINILSLSPWTEPNGQVKNGGGTASPQTREPCVAYHASAALPRLKMHFSQSCSGWTNREASGATSLIGSPFRSCHTTTSCANHRRLVEIDFGLMALPSALPAATHMHPSNRATRQRRDNKPQVAHATAWSLPAQPQLLKVHPVKAEALLFLSARADASSTGTPTNRSLIAK
jgi:hypothetical protein